MDSKTDTDWPEASDGSVDWETVFEDSSVGLLPLIAEARTPRALRESAILVIKKLYSRDDDPAEVERFIRELSELVPDDLPVNNLSDISDVVTGLLRQIKRYRIRKVFAATPQKIPTAIEPGATSTRTIVFSSQKGGSGKTTLCGQLAVQAELAGHGPVALIDTDPQGSLSGWWNARGHETPVFVQTSVEGLFDAIAELRRLGIKLVFIDTQPTVTETIHNIIRYGDLIVIPTRPSPHDLRAIGPTVDLVEQCKKPLIFAINCATRKAKLNDDVAIALSQHGTVAPIIVHSRVDFATSMIDGKSVMEINPDGKSAEEIRNLWDYIDERLRSLESDGVIDDQLEQHGDTDTNAYKIFQARQSD